MKHALLILAFLMYAGSAYGEDLRAASQKARAEHEAALAEARKSKERIVSDKKLLSAQIEETRRGVSSLKAEIAELESALSALEVEGSEQEQKRSDETMDMREYTGVVKESARDLKSVLSQSFFTAWLPDRVDRIDGILAENRFPGISEIDTMTELFFDEMARAGEVDLREGAFVDPSGEEVRGDVLTVGKFCAVYEKDCEAGFLSYGEEAGRFFALSASPPWPMERNLKAYIRGESEDVHFDFSRGAALKQISHRSTLTDKVEKGGPIVWPILAIGLFALAIAMERTLFLNRVHANTDRLMGKVNELAGRGDWSGCDAILEKEKGRPVNNVLRAGLAAANEKRETLESILQEAILKELPRLERFLPALNIMGAVSPLLGLLGTVTGMISTFEGITLYGTGDPRTMSGGISEALITTMLGLSVAIPVMLAHTFLRRRVEHVIGDMEEKAVALSNIICRECLLTPVAGKRQL